MKLIVMYSLERLYFFTFLEFIKCDPTSKIAPYRNYVQSSGNKITAMGMDYDDPTTILTFHKIAKK